jgi:poly-beta-hydroxyalkanoate depolymerase
MRTAISSSCQRGLDLGRRRLRFRAMAGPNLSTQRRTVSYDTLCPALNPGKKRHHLQPGAQHEDLFEGPTWAAEILPLVREVIRSSN